MGPFSTATAAASVFDVRLCPEQYEDVEEVFTTDTMLPTATCSCFCTRSFEFSSVSLCKISFSSSTYARLLSSVLKENRHNIQKYSLGDVLSKRCSF